MTSEIAGTTTSPSAATTTSRRKSSHDDANDNNNSNDTTNDTTTTTTTASTTTDSTTTTTTKLKASLVGTNRKVEASLLTAIETHLEQQYSPCNRKKKTAGLDFLDAKNSLLLSYLIELVVYLKARLRGGQSTESAAEAATRNLRRLNEMKTALDKTRSLDKKLRYQIDKLLQAENAATFASSGPTQEDSDDDDDENGRGRRNGNKMDDPLQYRPDPKALRVDGGGGDDGEGSSSSDEDRSSGATSDNAGDDDDDDDDLEAAKRTIAKAKKSSKSVSKKNSRKDATTTTTTQEDDELIYRAPRHTAMPYLPDQQEREAARQKRRLRRLRTSELAQSLRHQYSDVPETEDVRGGTEYGQQARAAKRLAEREAERTKYEEETMMRLTISRQEKKERKRIMRLEGANLNGIADLGNLVRDASHIIDSKDNNNDNDDGDDDRRRGGAGGRRGGKQQQEQYERFGRTERYANGKRKKEMVDDQGREIKAGRKSGGGGRAKNSYQAALYGGSGGDHNGGSGKSKKKRSKR